METIRKIAMSDNITITIGPDEDVGGWVQISVSDEHHTDMIVFDPKYAKDIANSILLCAKEVAEQ